MHRIADLNFAGWPLDFAGPHLDEFSASAADGDLVVCDLTVSEHTPGCAQPVNSGYQVAP